GLKDLYINSVEEVPTSYAAQYCFKLMGILGVLLHPQPSSVLMICFGGGIAAGTTIQYPEVKSLEVVDIEESVIRAARLLAKENNNLLGNKKVKVIIEDGRNYLFMSSQKYPVIVSDSTHPKSADSWVLYTRQFYQAVKKRLSKNGVFVQWVPFHRMTTSEYKIIVKTFLSVFPHTSLWLTHAFDEMGRFMKFSLLVATPRPLSISFKLLQKKLRYPAVSRDLFPWNLNYPLGILDNFLCGEQRIKEWTKDVPLNTDNLPWSYYTTKYSKGEKYSIQDFLAIAENVWPYLKNTGNQEESQKLKEQLNLLFQRKKLFMSLKFKEALNLLPQEKKALKEKENIKASLRYLKGLAKFYPDDAKRLLWLARSIRTIVHLQNGDAGEKEYLTALLQQAIQANPNFYESHLELADLLLKRGRKADAASHYEKVLELKPDSFIALMMLGNIRGEEGKLEEAVQYFLKALKIEPRNSALHHNLATIFLLQKKTDKAIQHLNKALAVNPQNAEIHNTLGAALLEKGQIEEAKLHFEQALKIQPHFRKAMINLAQTEIQKGNYASAIDILYKALELKPEDEQSRYLLAISLVQENKFSEAINTLKEGLQFFPHKVKMLTLLVKLLLTSPDRKLEDRQLALALSQRACRLTQEKDPECLDILASAYASLGNFLQAAKIARQAYNLALSLNQNQLAENIKKRLDFFESRR
ncbi:MAG: fused MFS/spermidine synthase, partial [Candidatus Aminicenantales bacterium]